jgi:hypothetical protein
MFADDINSLTWFISVKTIDSSEPVKLLAIPGRISSALNDEPASSQAGSLPRKRIVHFPKEHTKGVNALTWCGEFGVLMPNLLFVMETNCCNM